MEVICKKCKHANKLGAIFCRNCGEKLEFDGVDPKKFKTQKTAKKRVKIDLLKYILIILAVCVITVLVLIVLPNKTPELAKYNSKDSKKALETVKKFEKKEELKTKIYISAETASLILTKAVNNNMLLDEEYDSSIYPRILVSSKEENINVFCRFKVIGIPLVLQLSFIPKEEKKGFWTLAKWQIGQFSGPKAWGDAIFDWVEDWVDDDDFVDYTIDKNIVINIDKNNLLELNFKEQKI